MQSAYAGCYFFGLSKPTGLVYHHALACISPTRKASCISSHRKVCIKNGFIIKRAGFRKAVVYKGEIKDLKILRDSYIAEIFVNGGEEVYSVLL